MWHSWSSGGAGIIVLGFSGWLGKVWADRLMQKEQAKFQREIEDFKAQALRSLEQEKASQQRDLESFKAQALRDSDLAAQTLRERVALYKESVTPILDLYAQFQIDLSEVDAGTWRDFEQRRLVVSATLAMFAPLAVFDNYNNTVDYIQDCREGIRRFDFAEFRRLGFVFLDAIRQDLGNHSDPLVYHGPR